MLVISAISSFCYEFKECSWDLALSMSVLDGDVIRASYETSRKVLELQWLWKSSFNRDGRCKVGIYGYTAYSASKFALHGLAEALQQEVIADDIHITLIFPLDTDTPGLEEENKVKPQLTSIIAASSGAMKADEVAKKALDGIKSGSFIVPCNLEGLLLSIATAGLSPQRSVLMAFVEVVAAGLMHFAGLCFQWNWYGSIEKWHAQRRSK